MVYPFCVLLFLVGLYGAMTQKNLIKIIISVTIMEYAVNLLLILIGYRAGGIAPIIDYDNQGASFAAASVDPFPQAMVLTAIVISLGVLALLIAISLRLYHRYGTYDITEIRRLRG
jgi:multicomponent Na+:H+ antiporter subunit C